MENWQNPKYSLHSQLFIISVLLQRLKTGQPAARVQMIHSGDVSCGKPEVSCIQHSSLGTFKQEPKKHAYQSG